MAQATADMNAATSAPSTCSSRIAAASSLTPAGTAVIPNPHKSASTARTATPPMEKAPDIPANFIATIASATAASIRPWGAKTAPSSVAIGDTAP